MARVQLPPVQNKSGRYVEGQRITSVTDTDGNAWPCYTTRTGSTPVNFSTMRSGPEGEFAAYASPNTVVITYENDVYDNPKTIELVSGEDLEGMLTIDDIPGFADTSFSPADYGGDPTGLVDSTDALQDAINAADAVNGTVHLGHGTAVWLFSSTVTGANDIRITSSGAGMGGSTKGAVLKYTGTGEGAALDFTNKGRWEIDHVRFEYNSTSFTGPWLKINGASVDCLNWHVHHVRGSYTGTGEGPSMGYIAMENAIVGKISESGFDDAQNLLVFGTTDPTPTGRGYVNNIQVTNCIFNHSWDDGAILISSGDAENLCIDNCQFEAGGASGHSAIRGTNSTAGDPFDNLIYNMTVSNCWFGDNSAGDLVWIEGLNSLGNSAPIHITDNFIDSPGSSGKIVTVGENGALIIFTNNRVSGGLAAVGTSPVAPGGPYKVFAWGNALGGGCPLFETADPPAEKTRLGPLTNSLNGQVTVDSNSAFDDQDFSLLAGVTVGGVIPQAADPYPVTNNGALIYEKVVTGGRRLCLQTRTNDVDNGVQLMGGTAPLPKVTTTGDGVAFNGATPAAQPDYTVTNRTTDRTYDCNATTTDELADVLGTLILDLTNIGLLQ